MSSPVFKVGDHVEHYEGPGGRGGNPRCYGLRGVILRMNDNYAYLHVGEEFKHLLFYPEDRNYSGPWTLQNLRLVSKNYSPEQSGDTDDDV